MAQPAHPSTAPASAANSDDHADYSPDWSLISFAVPCSRCGENLHGLDTPTCPACELSFAWSSVLPIDDLCCPSCDYHLYACPSERCPECGEAFDWPTVLAAAQRRQTDFIEYRLRQSPFVATRRLVGIAWRPWKLWTTVSVHDPPAVRTLLTLLLAVAAALALLPLVLRPVLHVSMNGLQQVVGNRTVPGTWMGMRRTVSFDAFAETWSIWSAPVSSWWYVPAAIWAGWAVVLYGSLLILQQSMARRRVRHVHVVRVVAYTMVAFALPVFLYALISVLGDLAFAGVGPDLYELTRHISEFGVLAPTSGIALAVLHVRFAYRRYLRISHATAIAICMNFITLLFLLAGVSMAGILQG